MYGFLAVVLLPITVPMGLLLKVYVSALGSPGLAIILLSATFSLLMLPLTRRAQLTERRVSQRMKAVRTQVAERRGNLKGEELFDLTEDIYKENGFHPIQATMTGASLLVMLPVLISSILVLSESPLLDEASFLFIKDLSHADHLLGPINVLPLVMFGITLVDALVRFRHAGPDLARFCVISGVMLVLVYNLAAGLVIYWISNNLIALLLAFLSRQRNSYAEE